MLASGTTRDCLLKTPGVLGFSDCVSAVPIRAQKGTPRPGDPADREGPTDQRSQTARPFRRAHAHI